MLDTYILQTRRLLHDAGADFYSDFDLTSDINEARQQVAAEGQCIRVLPPSTAGVLSIAVLTPGSGYTTATVTLGAPNLITGVQATATPNIVAGAITSYTVTLAGSGYYIIPSVTITGDGTGATAVATLAPALSTVSNQELFGFSQANVFVVQTPGVRAVLDVQQVAVYWGNLKPALEYKPWTLFNAYFRAWPQFSNFPTIWSKYGQGEAGTVYWWPIPQQVLGMDWDCICVPINLVNDQTVEAIPAQWTNAVQYYACYLALLGAQRHEEADKMFGFYMRQMARARAFSQRNLTQRPYGVGTY
jgi:hypothetical protein